MPPHLLQSKIKAVQRLIRRSWPPEAPPYVCPKNSGFEAEKTQNPCPKIADLRGRRARCLSIYSVFYTGSELQGRPTLHGQCGTNVSHHVRVAQDLDGGFAKSTKARELRWKSIAKAVENTVAARSEAFALAQHLKPRRYCASSPPTRFFRSHAQSATNDDDDGANSAVSPFSRQLKSFELHTHTPAAQMLYHLGKKPFAQEIGGHYYLNDEATARWCALAQPSVKKIVLTIKIPAKAREGR
ncbi:hypothetical protein BV22DRAFT_1050143 [Leucogyrophana mollusca]|uniref:Uncharacterized protein n=1 Tax=Leucogyrophana mollusca TaxID=85980 RepID=A0ACB8B777_9AGAM|nr:hypothetical protein BV22DRAFT_1050143 [Leucogyrophana mollusca]